MSRLPIYFADSITQGEIAQALRDAGLHLHTEAGTRLVVDRVPQWLRHEEAEVIPMAKAKRRRA